MYCHLQVHFVGVKYRTMCSVCINTNPVPIPVPAQIKGSGRTPALVPQRATSTSEEPTIDRFVS